MSYALRVSPERRAAAKRARTTVVVLMAVLIALAVFAMLAFPPGEGTRVTLTGGAIALGIGAILMLLRLALIRRKADRLLTDSGQVIAFSSDGITVSDDVQIPWSAVSGVWANDRGAAFRAQGNRRGPFGAISRVMVRAGTSTIDLLIGVSDTARIADPRGLVKRQRENRGRIELPFGAWHGPEELAAVVQAAQVGLQGYPVPARYSTGALDYGIAWAGTVDDAATIAERESAAAAQTQS